MKLSSSRRILLPKIISIIGPILLLTNIADARRPQSAATFDFIVVGGGTAGCAVASRLSENGKYTVLILETGGYPLPESFVPGLGQALIPNPAMVKLLSTVPQRNAGLQDNGIMAYGYGNVLGGASSANAMFFNRGSPLDFDNWANVTGDTSWSYTNMLKYFKKVEDYVGDLPSEQRGSGGPITVSRPSYLPGYDVWRETAKAFGYSYADPNGPQRIGFTTVDVTSRLGRRVSSFTGYIQPVLKTRRNLNVYTNALVTRIVFEGMKAVGVTYVVNASGSSRENFVVARKEVILSAGSVESPVLLMKSGIGPKDVLQDAKVKPVKYLPVGENFQDHPAIPLALAINNRSDVLIVERDLTPENMKIYNETGDGPYSTFTGSSGQAFLASCVAEQDGDKDWADLHLTPIHSSGLSDGYLLPNDLSRRIADWEVLISATATLGRPKSRGSVTLNRTDINGTPLIDPQYFSHPDDMTAAVDGIKSLLRFFEEGMPYRKIGARLLPDPLPNCAHLQFRSDKYWECYIRQTAKSIFHGAGSCRMGKAEDPTAVLDTELKVIGIDNLRVVDNSIMPAVTNANTQAPAYAIAEKAADMILRHWQEASKKEASVPEYFRLSSKGWTR